MYYLFTTQKPLPHNNKHRKPKKFVLAIDATDKPTYSKEKREDKNIVGGKRKASTNFFFRFATIQIADKKYPLTLYSMHCTKDTTNEEIVEKLITEARKVVRIKLVLIDSDFDQRTQSSILHQTVSTTLRY